MKPQLLQQCGISNFSNGGTKNVYFVLHSNPAPVIEKVYSKSPRGAFSIARKNHPKSHCFYVFENENDVYSGATPLYKWRSKESKAKDNGFKCSFCRGGIVRSTGFVFCQDINVWADVIKSPLRMKCDKCERVYYIGHQATKQN